jgi:hypothetical protein
MSSSLARPEPVGAFERVGNRNGCPRTRIPASVGPERGADEQSGADGTRPMRGHGNCESLAVFFGAKGGCSDATPGTDA